MYSILPACFYLTVPAVVIGPPKKDTKQSIKNKNNRSLSFHFDFLGLWLCPFVRFVRIFPYMSITTL